MRNKGLHAVRWFGGKGHLWRKILPYFPPHHTYVEPFGGSAAVLLNKPPAAVEVYNDIDEGLVNFFKVMSNPRLFKKFYRRVSVLPRSRQLYKEALKTWQRAKNPVVKAVKWYIVTRQSFGGRFGASWGYDVRECHNGWMSAIKNLPQIHERIQHVYIEYDDWRKVIPRFDTPDTLFYCDPPYPHATRSQAKYQHELTDNDHVELLDMLKHVQGMVVLSSYPNPIYDTLTDFGWYCTTFSTTCSVAGRTRHTGLKGVGAVKAKQPRTEVLWVSPKTLARLAAAAGFHPENAEKSSRKSP